MSLFDKIKIKTSGGCAGCAEETERFYGPQKALVAFGCLGSGHRNAIVVQATPGLTADFREGGIDAGDVWVADKKGAPSEGSLEVWEGRIVFTTTPSSPNGPEEHDVDYEGEWRAPTDAEWTIIMKGGELWPPLPPLSAAHTCGRQEFETGMQKAPKHG